MLQTLFVLGLVIFALVGLLGIWSSPYENTWFVTLGLFGGIIGTSQFLFLRQYGLKSGAGWIAANLVVLGVAGGALGATPGNALGLGLLIFWVVINFFWGPVLIGLISKHTKD